MVEVRDAHPVAPADLRAIREFDAEVAHERGRAALGEAVWRDLETGGHPGSVGVFATAGGRLVGYVHVAPSDTFSPRHWAAAIAVQDRSVAADLLAAAVEHVHAHGGGEIVLWILEPSADDDAAARAVGFVASRDLHQMQVELPLTELPRWPDGTTVRPFVVGVDDEAWLQVNNRAFLNHSEQGGWTEQTLSRRLSEPWFDASGFLLAWDALGLAGFCWTKVHDREPEPLGEIFVIGVDPSRQGTGLGRALVLAGLRSLSDRGIRTGMLFVDATNDAAVGLYRSLGFVERHRDRAYSREVAAS